MFRFALIITLALTSLAHADTKLSVMGSLLYNSPETKDIDDVDGIDEESGLGFGLGMRALMGINDQLHFRSGAGIIQKKFSYKVDASGDKGEFDLSFIYLNIPLTLYWKASPQVGFFGGTALNAKLSDDCDASGDFDTCTIKNEKTIVIPAIIGFDFSFTDKIGMELSYEYGLTETAKNLRVHSAVASFLYHLD
jgi:hypothetical protein